MSLNLKPKPVGRGDSKTSTAKLYLLDGHSLTFRAYYALRQNLTAPDGSQVGAVYGFLRTVLKILDDVRPDYFAVVFDAGGRTFREELFDRYKANRDAAPPEFDAQVRLIYRLLRSMHIPTYTVEGFEADDVLATLATELSDAGGETVLISADKDLFQLVDDRVTLLRVSSFGGEEFRPYDAAAVEKRLGVKPGQVADWLALVGDSSDNIPGVPGIGEKGAAKLLQEYGSLENILAHAGEIKNKRQQKSLSENAEQARVSLKLATVERKVPVEWSLEDCRLDTECMWTEDCINLLAELGFNSLLKERDLEATRAVPTPAEMPETNYRAIVDEAELQAYIERAATAEWLALDTETSALDPLQAALVGISLSIENEEAIYVPIGHRVGKEVDRQIPLERVREILNPLLSAKSGRSAAGSNGKSSPEGKAAGPKLSAHNAKFDWEVLELAGFTPRPPDFDTMLASFVLDPGRPGGHGLKSLCSVFCGVRMVALAEIIGSGKSAVSVDEVPVEDIYEYACADADITLKLTRVFNEELEKEPGLRALMDQIEMPLIPVLMRMEQGGIAVNMEHLRRLGVEMSAEIDRLGKAVCDCAGLEFNPDSPKQTSKVLFEDLCLPPGKKTKSGYSTDNSVLESLVKQHEIIQNILDYRAVKKLKSTYADTLPRQINPRTKRIHTSFNQTVAQTGRLSSDSPNLQNIPIRSAMGREIRRTFIPDAPDHKLLSADYSQIELRILAHLSKDKALVEAYRNHRDIHALTSSQVFGVEEADVTSEMRSQAKVINFGIIYGMSAHGLSQRLHISRGEAARFIDAYFATYPGVRAWIDATLEQARANGYVETMMKRRRVLPDLSARNSIARNNAERIAVNTPIQGSSADMIKLAMLRIDRELAAEAPGARMVLQVHDELIFSVPEDRIDATRAYVTKAMAEALPLDVPIVVDVSLGETWADCE